MKKDVNPARDGQNWVEIGEDRVLLVGIGNFHAADDIATMEMM